MPAADVGRRARRRPRRSSPTRRALGLACIALFSSIVAPSALPAPAHGQDAARAPVVAIDDDDLERVSDGRTVMVGSLSSARVSTLSLETYVARVVAGEAEAAAPDAELDVLAIAARTYAIFNARRHARDGFDLCDTTHCQVPRAATAATRRAAFATAGRILTWKGRPAEIFYSASCGGRSADGTEIGLQPLPYLRTHSDDAHDDEKPWTLELGLDEIEQRLRATGMSGRLRDVHIDGRNRSKRVARVRLTGMRPDSMRADQFRLAISARELKSTAFDLERRGDTLRFTGRGYGHGVGLCVVGAGNRARRGENVERILAQYFPGLEVAALRK